MDTQTLQLQIEKLTSRIDELERNAIQLNLDPTIALYFAKNVTPSVTAITSLLPTTIYSTSSPSGTANIGSIWCQDTGSLATRAIYSYNGSTWIQMK